MGPAVVRTASNSDATMKDSYSGGARRPRRKTKKMADKKAERRHAKKTTAHAIDEYRRSR